MATSPVSVWSITRSSWVPQGPLHPISDCTCGQHLGWKYSWHTELCQVCSSALWSTREVRRSFWYPDKPQRKQHSLSTTSYLGLLCQQQGGNGLQIAFLGAHCLQQAWKSPFFIKNLVPSSNSQLGAGDKDISQYDSSEQSAKQGCSWGDLLVSSHPTAVQTWGGVLSFHICWLKSG